MELPGNGIPVSESQPLFTRIVSFWQVLFFLYFRNDQYKIVDFHYYYYYYFFEKQDAKKYLLIDLLKFDYRKVKLDDELKIQYGDGPCGISIIRFGANIIRDIIWR